MVVVAMPVPMGTLAETADVTDRLGLVGAPLVEGFGLVASRAAAESAMGRRDAARRYRVNTANKRSRSVL